MGRSISEPRVRELCRQCVTTPHESSLSTMRTARTWFDQSHRSTCRDPLLSSSSSISDKEQLSVLCADSADRFQHRRATRVSLCRPQDAHRANGRCCKVSPCRAWRAVYSQSLRPRRRSVATGSNNQPRLLASGLQFMNADEQEINCGDQMELAMRVVRGMSQPLCIGSAGSDLRVALSAERRAPRSEYCPGLRSNHDIH